MIMNKVMSQMLGPDNLGLFFFVGCEVLEDWIMKQLERFFSHDTSETMVQLVKSLFVGGVATLVDMGTLYVLNKVLGLHYIPAAIVGYVLGLVVNYVLSTYWVFNKRALDNAKLEFTVFAIIALIGLGLNLLIIWLMQDLLGIDVMIGKIVSTVIVYLWNFVARKKILYK